jgi:polyisoprenoid-binding protein YceI
LDLSRSSVELAFETAAIKVVSSDGPASDIPEVQATMAGPRLLDVARFPSVEFRSRKVEGRSISAGVYEISLTGELSLHGVRRELRLPMRVEVTANTLVASGRTALRQTDFGIPPVSVWGVVKVRDELAVELRILARSAP